MKGVLEQLFRDCFLDNYNTVLLGGVAEPLYLPASQDTPHHRIFYREDYFSSALHEVAHWCIAGERRRLLEDYGYWYAPDGRDLEQQALFESVEVRPQALEWHFALASAAPFRISADNLSLQPADSARFTSRVRQEAIDCIEKGLPARGELFRQALARQFGGVSTPDQECFRN
jgi:elongation factor P hydroxylase